MNDKKPFPCRIGLHAWFRDCALIASANCCNNCGQYQDAAKAQALADERARLTAAPAGASLGDLYVIALHPTPPLGSTKETTR